LELNPAGGRGRRWPFPPFFPPRRQVYRCRPTGRPRRAKNPHSLPIPRGTLQPPPGSLRECWYRNGCSRLTTEAHHAQTGGGGCGGAPSCGRCGGVRPFPPPPPAAPPASPPPPPPPPPAP